MRITLLIVSLVLLGACSGVEAPSSEKVTANDTTQESTQLSTDSINLLQSELATTTSKEFAQACQAIISNDQARFDDEIGRAIFKTFSQVWSFPDHLNAQPRVESEIRARLTEAHKMDWDKRFGDCMYEMNVAANRVGVDMSNAWPRARPTKPVVFPGSEKGGSQ